MRSKLTIMEITPSQKMRNLSKEEAVKIIHKYCAEGGAHEVETLRIGWPADILKCGIILVDSPGLDESKSVNRDGTEEIQHWINLVKRNILSSRASICVVSADSIGDSITGMLRIIKREQGDKFDVNSLFFVMTHLDQTRNLRQRDLLRGNLMRPLKEIFAHFNFDTNFVEANLKSAMLVRRRGLMDPDHKSCSMD
eukprot:TRINITY_DN716_c0_g1_i5.p2 TRINITY_DN716_c0_g1~~TRINITY_DN716_c0_g1_i5.p2  ORF type:complete len:196 (-),score=38.09 TRINITY_DN716_c0_g1_i5:360-947(-)